MSNPKLDAQTDDERKKLYPQRRNTIKTTNLHRGREVRKINTNSISKTAVERKRKIHPNKRMNERKKKN